MSPFVDREVSDPSPIWPRRVAALTAAERIARTVLALFPPDAHDEAYQVVGDGGGRITAGDCRAIVRFVEGR